MSDMSREEAIKILKDTLYDEKTPNNYIQAVRMGREALENQLTKEEAIYLIECLGGHTARCGVKDISIKCMDKLCKIKELKNDNP